HGPIFLCNFAHRFVLLYGLYRRYTRVSVTDTAGPSASNLLGNLYELYQGQAAEADFKWQTRYGGIVHIKSAVGFRYINRL
ncbi:hypothetical protein SERLA73DRAFT_86782, partial [Serpula lacrymans var. lacrymans S7.3]